jgi:hypothetical protein
MVDPVRRLMGFAVVLGVVLAFGAITASADTGSANISVKTEAAADQPTCRPAANKDATATSSSSSTQWVFTITAKAPICEPVTAAIYSMPNNIFWPWPQQKVESVTFQVPAGTTTITFTKSACDPQQFDVVTGNTPDRIQPTTGPMHGPLLFMPVPWSATQNFVSSTANCGSTTTTGVTTTSVLGSTTLQSTTSTPATTTTAATTTSVGSSTSVQGATTIVGSTTTNLYTPSKVEPATETRAVSPSSEANGLAATGFDSQAFGIAGLMLIVMGLLARRFSAIRDRS